jgi:hypothetical protein
MAEIISAQEQRHMALKNTEITVLRNLLADEFINVHSSGRVESKDDYIASVTSGKTKFVDFSTSNVAVMPYGVTAVVVGEIKAHLMHGDEHAHRSFRYASAWVKRSGKWRLTLWQHTTLKPV